MKRALVLLAACGGTAAPPPAPAGPPASLVATARVPGDVVVAQVNGRPVFGSCVQAQAARGATAKAALEQCIDFELLAQAAERRGIATDHEVAFATRTALVNELVAREFEDRFATPGELGDFWTQTITKNMWRIKHEEYRASAYVRVPVPAGAPAEADAAAKAIAETIAKRLAAETGLLAPQFFELAAQAAGPVKLDHMDVDPRAPSQLEEHYAAALYGVREIGRTSPAVRTKWGWDVVLYTADLPATDPTQEQLEHEWFPDVKRAYFTVWVNQIAKGLGVHVELDQKNVAKLEDLP